MNFSKQCLGIDVSKDKLDCCLSWIDGKGNIKYLSQSIFMNTPKGFTKLRGWLNSKKKDGEVSIIMEATGVYYENLAYYLREESTYKVVVVLPARTKYYFKSLSLKTKTDKVDAQKLSQYGLERRQLEWNPPSKALRKIKSLNREYRDNKKEINRLKNQLHAKEHSYDPLISTLKRLKKQIALIEKHCLQIELELKDVMEDEEFLSKKVEQLSSIPGIGFMTAVALIGETNGFILIKNAKQLVSYAGLDITHNQSGQKSGKSKISKKGNAYIRQALYMPALSASRRIAHMNKFYERINERKSCKKVGLIAVARKLLVLAYTLWKKDEYYKEPVTI